MKRLFILFAFVIGSLATAQNMGAAQRAGVTAHINEIAGHLGLMQISCPSTPAPILPSDPVLCFTHSFLDGDMFRMMWDMYNSDLFVASPATAAAPWALDSDTGAIHRTFNLAGVSSFAVVFTQAGNTATIYVGAAPR